MEQAGQLVTALQLTVKALQFYTADHPRVVEALVHLEQMYTTTLAHAPRLTLTVARGALLVDGEPYANPPAHVKMLAVDLDKRHLGGIVLLAGATRRELLELVKLLLMRPEQIKAAGGADAVLNAAEVHHIRLSHVRYEAVTEQEEVVWSSTLRRMQQEGGTVTTADARNLIERTDAEQMGLLRERLAEMGISREQFDELLDVIGWDKLSLDERVEKLLTGDRIFDFPPSKLQHFIRELLDANRASDVHYLVERYVRGITSPSASIRQSVADGLGQIITFHLPQQTEQITGAAILNHLLRESDPKVKSVAVESAANLMTRLIATSRCEPATRVLERLEAGVPGAGAEVARAVAEAPRSEAIIGQIGTADADAFNRVVMPLVQRLGGRFAPAIIEALGHEEDRNRRGRLVKALKTMGEPAFPALLETLRSQVWFVVRNALNVLGDIGTPEMVEPIGRKLDHSDARVRRAAARALGKIGGTEAEQLLVGAIHDRDPETQAEVLLCLGAMKASSAVPALAELMKPKGFFARDVPMIRVAAAKALAAIDTPAARDALKNAEPAKRV